MNLEILLSEAQLGRYEMCKFDKRRSLPFSYSQSLKFKSNHPIKQSYSIVVSQTIPVLYLSSTEAAAIIEI